MLRSSIRRGIYHIFDASVVIVILLAVGYIYIVTYGEGVLRNHPEAISVASSTIITNADGTEISRLQVQTKGYAEYADLMDMPNLLKQAFLATEDRRFYNHDGLDFIGIGRAVVQDVLHMNLSQGGSSITQQLARNLYLNGDKTLVRKVNEMSIAMAMEKRFSKDELLELYLNHIYMGRQQYGVKSAAWRYFGIKDLHQLEIWQMATLAGIPKGPSIYNPVDREDLSKERRSVVLGLMHKQGIITKKQMEEARSVDYTPPNLTSASAPGSTVPAYVSALDAVIEEASRLTGKSGAEIESAGWTIRTGLDDQAQLAMEQAFRESSRFTDDREDEQVQAGMVILDQHNGEVKAMMGGRDPVKGGINRATTDARQPGSAFKPIIAYGPALESGRFKPESMLPDQRMKYGSYQPSNLGGRYRGTVTMSQAIENSINAPAVWLLHETGLGRAHQFAGRLGIELGREDLNLSIALGGLHEGVSPLKMAQAYSVFANNGKFNTAHLIREITDSRGRTIYAFKPENKQVISNSTATAMTGMLQDVVSQGTGSRAQLSQHKVAGKTGTTQAALPGVSKEANRDLWFVGYTSKWTAAVWMGFDRTDAEHYMRSGSGVAADLFASVMKRVLP
ncbi:MULTISPECIES: transglycosylase domain-containing protein [unclassified Paenibacillus]|uniref:transglycosylase domain-containing protein n=1 Tax=unclassified Paenibacillus TaxID=185978 RepID=UPI0009A6D67C|nr:MULTISPECIES: PBP1A family penicillin-binding protein [unclassified Paenibacillus]SLK04307.1 penicillin-binding protein 2A [Paenibacillus sp. RU5A]SOC69653.1 penicillin-binding protein 2A [Paenibacillus sp. RU26A]SOC72057.1 penicillin-binding protein 2A [Paenibacillus sp. RU5M]